MKTLRFVSAQPANKYYAWQVEVMLNNFLANGVNLNEVDIVCWKDDDKVPEEWSKLANGYAARFFFYNDTRQSKHYISSIRPNILKQHFKEHSYLTNECIFYHDCDIIFTKPIHEWITWNMVEDDIWYGSDTRWYISHSYIKSKGQDVIDKMCEIMGLSEKLIQDNELNAIGAQYIMKGIDWRYWERVESDSEKLYKEVSELNTQKVNADPTHHPLQIWCADMWAVLWGAWRLGYQTQCIDNMAFSWGTSNEEDYFKNNIMHNAGVVDNKHGMFFKADYINEYPYGKELDITPNTASWHYWNWVQKTGLKSKLNV